MSRQFTRAIVWLALFMALPTASASELLLASVRQNIESEHVVGFRGPSAAIDSEGDALFTWIRQDGEDLRVDARALSAAGVLGQVETVVSGLNISGLRVANDAAGDALIVWHHSADVGIQTRTRSAAGMLGPSEAIGPGSGVEVAMNAAGDAVFVWLYHDGLYWRIQARTRSAAGVLGPILTLTNTGKNASEPRVAIDADGDAVVVWRRFDGAYWRIQARALSAAGVLGSVQILSNTGKDATLPKVAIDADGDAVIVWGRKDQVQVRGRSAVGALSSIQTVATLGWSGDIAVDPNGNAILVWVAGGNTDQVQARTRSAAGLLGPIQTLWQRHGNASDPRIAVDAEGDAIVVWLRRRDQSIDARYHTYARTRSAAGVLGPIHSFNDNRQDVFGASVVSNHKGDAVVIWHQSYLDVSGDFYYSVRAATLLIE